MTSASSVDRPPLPRIAPGSPGTSLPTDFTLAMCRRVGIAAMVMATLWVIIATMLVVTMKVVGYDPAFHYAWTQFGYELVAAQLVLAAGVAWAAGRYSSRHGVVLAIGLGYEIALAVGVALLTRWNPPLPGGQVGLGVSWLCVGILAYPAIVPAPPRTTFIVATIAASMDPLFYGLALWAGVTTPLPTYTLVWAFVPTYICAGLAVIPATIVRRLGRAVREARELGNYELGELLGAGGMGEVYRASHRLLARPAAVKLIAADHFGARGEAGQAQIAERFRREASAAAALRSPHTIELYDFGIANDGALYYAMELLDGIDLQVLVERFGALPPARAIHLLRQACLSLAEAHRRGLVHRDIKPSNLMTCRMGTQVDFLKVLDFGLVKMDVPASDALTAPDLTAGTPAYMAPEAIDGVRDLDHRADLYALGCVGYWILSGRPVFEGPSALAVLVKHGREPPPRLQGGAEPVPADLEALVLQCLEKDPARRPADALALARELAQCVCADQWRAEDAAAWWDAHRPESVRLPA